MYVCIRTPSAFIMFTALQHALITLKVIEGQTEIEREKRRLTDEWKDGPDKLQAALAFLSGLLRK